MIIPLLPTRKKNKIKLSLDVDHIDDIFSVKPFELEYSIEKNDFYKINLKANIELFLACSRSFEEVKFNLKLDSMLSFGSSQECDFVYTKNINLNEIVLGEIISQKPLVIYHDKFK